MARRKAVSPGRTRCMGQATSSADAAAKIKGMSSPGSPEAASPTKRSPRKAALRGKWSEEQLMTSDKSALIDADLVKLLASSAAWHGLDESEKREVLALLPSDVHPNPEPPADDPTAPIPVLPDSFVRYSNNWRDGIRQFQLDLQNGRYDPEWLRQANEAGRERADGDFDAFKEREYEEFWGQKQKLDWRVLTGEAAKVKLGALVQAGLIQVGDVWKFRHVLGKGPDSYSIEKEARVQEIHGSKLSFVIPTGQRVFLRSDITDSPRNKSEHKSQGEDKKTIELNNEPVSETIVDSYAPPLDKDSDPKLGAPKCELPVAADQESHPITSKSESAETNTADQINDKEVSPAAAYPDSHPITLKSENDEAGTVEQTNDPEVPSTLSTPLSTPRSLSPPWEEYDNQEISPNIEVVIMSPTKMPQPKRPVPQPATEPEAKRKRGRPRKTPLDSQPDPEQSDSASEEESEPQITSSDSPRLRVVLESYPKLDPTEYRQYRPQSPTKITNNSVNLLPEGSSESTKPMTSIEVPSTEEHSSTNTNIDMDMGIDIIELVPNHHPEQQPVPDMMETSPHSESTEVPAVETTAAPVPAEPTPLPTSHSESAGAQAMEATEATAQPGPAPLSPHPIKPTPVEPTNNEPEEIMINDITSPNALVQKILSADGRKIGTRIANAWRDFRCYRNNQDMGSLWDVRQAWFLKQNPS